MKSSMIRVLLTLTATGAIVVGCGDMPTTSATRSAKLEGAPVRSTSSEPLSVFATCGPNYETPQRCTAEASGGSGSGYTFTWETGTKVSTQGATSRATVQCPENASYIYEFVSVTDSDGGYAETQAQLWCSPW